MKLRAPDGHVYLSAQSAAEEVGVDRTTLVRWQTKGLLRPALTFEGRPYYRLVDVMRAELAAREAALRTSGSDKRVRRHGKVPAPVRPEQRGAPFGRGAAAQ